MTAPDPPPRPVSHRGEPQTPALVRLLRPVTAVAVVVVVIVALIWINGSSPSDHPARRDAAGVMSAGPVAKATPRLPTPRTSAGRRHAVVAPRTSPHPQTAAVTAPVTVLNNSRRTGLAHAVAARLRGNGWPVRTVGNLQGALPATTLYYAPGTRAAARRLAHDFGSIQRVAPNAAGGMHGRGLTLVLTRYWVL